MKCFKAIDIGIVVGGMFLASTAFAQPEQWLQYHINREGRAYHSLELTTNPPPNVALPRLNAQPYFARWITPMDPSGGRWLCLDRRRKSGPYDRLFFDSNGNGRLDDKSPVSASRIDQYNAFFDPVRIVFNGEDGPITYHLVLRFYKYQDEKARLLAASGGWYEGAVNVAGKKRRVQLIDGDVNGTFNDQSPDPYRSDRIQVEGDPAGERFLGRMLEVDGQLFQIEVARDGAYIKLQKAENVEFGPVHVPETISEFTAFGENGHFVRKPEKGEFTLPVGKYRIYDWKIARKDNSGAAWTMEGYRLPESASFEVAVGKVATLEIGEPVRTLFEATDLTNRGVAFTLRFQGRLGESIEMLRGGERPRGPLLTLTNLEGTFRYTNSFEFG